MNKPTKYTNSMLDKIIANSSYVKNSLQLQLAFEYARKQVDLTWNDILFGVENGYFPEVAAVEYARWQLEKDIYPEKVLELACVKKKT